MRNGRRRAVQAVAATVSLALLAAIPALMPTFAAPAVPSGQTLLVSTDPLDPSADNGAVTLSSDGTLAAYQTRLVGDGPTPWRLRLRDLHDPANRATTPLSPGSVEGDGAYDATAPSLSGDGSRVAYSVRHPDRLGTPPSSTPHSSTPHSSTGDNEIYVAERATPNEPTRITGIASDLPYQRTLGCDPTSSRSTGESCGPKLSADGHTVAFPARLSLASPYILPNVFEGNLVDASGNYLPLHDFGGAVRDANIDTIDIRVFGPGAVFTPPTVEPPGGRFVILPDDRPCDGAVGGGSSCQIRVQYTPPSCGSVGDQTSIATLRTNSGTPAGQTALALVGRGCVPPPPPVIRLRSALASPRAVSTTTTAARATACSSAAPSPWASPLDTDDFGNPVGVFGEVRLHTVALRTFTITNTLHQPARLAFASSSGCVMRLIRPAGDSGACVIGRIIDYGGSCTAYVRLQPRAVQPYAAMLSLAEVDGPGTAHTLFSGSGATDVVLSRSDTGGSFVSAPPEVVSVPDRSGGAPVDRVAPVDGRAPSVSADGRFVAFSSYCAPAADNTLPTALDCGSDSNGQQVYVRDTAANRTTLASLLPNADGALAPAPSAIQPSISGDGSRVAFTTETQISSDFTATGSTRGATGGFFNAADQVYVRDGARGQTVLVSTAGTSDPPLPAEYGSYRPAISRDGSTVAFASFAGDLTEGQVFNGGGPRVYVRDLGPDLGGPGTPGNELGSVGSVGGEQIVGTGDRPAIDADGGIIGFDSATLLTDDAPDGTQPNVYVRVRFPNPEVTPAELDFPEQPINTVGAPLAATVTNGGPGPMTVKPGTVVGPFQVVSTTCPAGVLHRDESCTIGVSAAPTSFGPQNGTLTVTSTATLVPPIDRRVTLVGVGITPKFTVRPDPVTFRPQGIGITSRPVTVTITNVSGAPLLISGKITPASAELATPGTTCTAPVAPTASCIIRVTFTPNALGTRTGSLMVTASGPDLAGAVSQLVRVTGSTLAPTLTARPAVIVVGRVALVSGEHFRPGTPVTLSWQPGFGTVTVVPDRTGAFTTQLIVFRTDLAGERHAVASTAGLRPVAGPPVLVVLGSLQAPDFSVRH
ncbi:MAG TPA: choice-of-anchor D domain-containing protein [Mycobacteriales bacterium]|nr:choice-of-anchor D domain-containing protein [Mycobacteriales bacterium]